MKMYMPCCLKLHEHCPEIHMTVLYAVDCLLCEPCQMLCCCVFDVWICCMLLNDVVETLMPCCLIEFAECLFLVITWWWWMPCYCFLNPKPTQKFAWTMFELLMFDGCTNIMAMLFELLLEICCLNEEVKLPWNALLLLNPRVFRNPELWSWIGRVLFHWGTTNHNISFGLHETQSFVKWGA